MRDFQAVAIYTFTDTGRRMTTTATHRMELRSLRRCLRPMRKLASGQEVASIRFKIVRTRKKLSPYRYLYPASIGNRRLKRRRLSCDSPKKANHPPGRGHVSLEDRVARGATVVDEEAP